MPPAQWGPLDANISMLFTELPMPARPAAAAAAGFTAVEAWWPFGAAVPGDAEVTAFERAVRDAGVQLVALNGFAGDMPAGERGILSWPGRQQEFLDNLDVLLGLGGPAGLPALQPAVREPGRRCGGRCAGGVRRRTS